MALFAIWSCKSLYSPMLCDWVTMEVPPLEKGEEETMPTFLDHHMTTLPPDMAKMAEDKLKSGVDEFGNTGINIYYSDTETWCLTDAPGAESVHKAHEAIGIKLGSGDVREVTSVV